jgi:hypothetical protein
MNPSLRLASVVTAILAARGPGLAVMHVAGQALRHRATRTPAGARRPCDRGVRLRSVDPKGVLSRMSPLLRLVDRVRPLARRSGVLTAIGSVARAGKRIRCHGRPG